MGGSRADFPPTSWGLVHRVQGEMTEERRDALESLCRRYWKPVYHYVRQAWSKSVDDAKDLTQAFFMSLLEGGALQRYRPDVGSFRTFLKVVLRGFVADQHDALRALKRGGGTKLLPLDGAPVLMGELTADPHATDPERLFDLSWKEEILGRAVKRTGEWFESAGRGAQFRVFEEYDLRGSDPQLTYAQLAARYGLTESVVRNYLFEVRERLRVEIRTEISQTVADLEQLEDEWKALFAG